MLFLLIATLFAAPAQATELPAALEKEMIEAVLDRCTVSLDAKFTLVSLKVEDKEVDQGSADTFFDATFRADSLGGDEITPVTQLVRVQAAVYAISNPGVKNTEILSVTSANKRLCD